MLIENGKDVKILDKNVELCRRADEELEGEAMVISYKYSTSEIFAEERLAQADMMIAATDNDEYNIIKCLEAREHGVRKVIAVNNEVEYYNLMHSLDIVVVRGPKMSAFHSILENLYSTHLVLERTFCGGKAVLYLRRILPGSKLTGKRQKPLSTRGVRLLLLHQNRIIPFVEPVVLEEGDIILCFALRESSETVGRWFNGL